MNEQTTLNYQRELPNAPLSNLVSCFWRLENAGTKGQVVTILPDGYFDVLFTSTNGGPYRAMLIGLSTKPIDYTVPAQSLTFTISFKLIAAEFILKQPIGYLHDTYEYLPNDSEWYTCLATPTLEAFVYAATRFINDQPDQQIDDKKFKLFNEIYNTHGNIAIDSLAASLHWKSRQINRYFQEYFGLALKTYCSILRFRASFNQLHNGRLFPENNYYDQAHFIREVNKFSETTPRHLAKNTGDRFIQLATLAAS